MTRSHFWMAILSTALLALWAAPVEAASLDDLELGELWSGQSWDKASLKDRTVVVEFWGYNCPPCRASLPHLVKLQKEHAPRGLVVLGVHSQNVEKSKVLDLCRQNEVNFSIFASGKIKGCQFSGIPKVFLINWKGEVCWDGHPSQLDGAVEDALRGAPDWLAGPRAYEKVKSEASKVRSRRGLGAAAKSLRQKLDCEDEQEKSEAAELLGRLEGYAKRARSSAESLIERGRPLTARKLLKDIAKDFKGDDIGDDAAAREKALSKDPAFKRELSAAKMLAGIEAMAARIDPPRRGQDLAKWMDKNRAALSRVQGMIGSLEKKYGDTKVCARAAALKSSLHLG